MVMMRPNRPRPRATNPRFGGNRVGPPRINPGLGRGPGMKPTEKFPFNPKTPDTIGLPWQPFPGGKVTPPGMKPDPVPGMIPGYPPGGGFDPVPGLPFKPFPGGRYPTTPPRSFMPPDTFEPWFPGAPQPDFPMQSLLSLLQAYYG